MRVGLAIAAFLMASAVGSAGCGGDDSDSSTPEGAVTAYFEAIGEADGETACGLLTEDALEGTAVAGVPATGADCVSAVNGTTPGEQSELTTETLEETATAATVKVTAGASGQQAVSLVAQLVKDGEQWKIDALAVSAVEP